jgi:hypothetical protein
VETNPDRYGEAKAFIAGKKLLKPFDLQLHLKSGYSEAEDYLHRMETEGLVGAEVPGGNRRVLDTDEARLDERICGALRSALAKKKLDIVAAVTGFPGGSAALRKLAHTAGEIDLVDRAFLSPHLAG